MTAISLRTDSRPVLPGTTVTRIISRHQRFHAIGHGDEVSRVLPGDVSLFKIDECNELI
jgi:hypothetical protein